MDIRGILTVDSRLHQHGSFNSPQHGARRKLSCRKAFCGPQLSVSDALISRGLLQLLTVALDNNKNAQGNAIRAFGLLAKQAGSTGALQPYLASIVQAFVAAFAKYQSRNILKLYDAIAQLSDAGGLASLNDENLLGSLMPPLIERWQAFGDDDPNLLYLLEVCARRSFVRQS